MAKSCPSSAFYWNDYYRDTRVLTLPTRAIWMDMLCRAHESQTRGRIRLSLGAWARWCACLSTDISLAVIELQHNPDVGVVEREILNETDLSNVENNVFITVVNRRMVREALFKENNAERQDRFRKKNAGNGDVAHAVTPLSRMSNTVSSSSLSSSSSSSEKKKRGSDALMMPDNWSLTSEMTDHGLRKGMTTATITHEFEACKIHHAESKFTAKGWESQTWQTWVMKWVSFGKKQVFSIEPSMPKSFRKLETIRSEHQPMPDDVRKLLAQGGKGKGMPA